MIEPIFTDAVVCRAPFLHVKIPSIIPEQSADSALRWLATAAPWKLRVEHFYEQEEFSLLTAKPAGEMGFLVASSFIEPLRHEIRNRFRLQNLPAVVDVNAHRLTPGQTIRVHNDFLDGEETHRVLIQLNDGWAVEQGGLLMLFDGPTPEEVHSIIVPKHRSGFVFEITHRSFHAVSQIKHGERYTLVYTFRAAD